MAFPPLTTRARRLRTGDLMIVAAIAALPFAAMGLLMRAPGPTEARVAAVALMVVVLVQVLAAWLLAGWSPGPRLAWLAGPLAVGVVLLSLGALAGLILLFHVHAIAASMIVATIVALAFYLATWD